MQTKIVSYLSQAYHRFDQDGLYLTCFNTFEKKMITEHVVAHQTAKILDFIDWHLHDIIPNTQDAPEAPRFIEKQPLTFSHFLLTHIPMRVLMQRLAHQPSKLFALLDTRPIAHDIVFSGFIGRAATYEPKDANALFRIMCNGIQHTPKDSSAHNNVFWLAQLNIKLLKTQGRQKLLNIIGDINNKQSFLSRTLHKYKNYFTTNMIMLLLKHAKIRPDLKPKILKPALLRLLIQNDEKKSFQIS